MDEREQLENELFIQEMIKYTKLPPFIYENCSPIQLKNFISAELYEAYEEYEPTGIDTQIQHINYIFTTTFPFADKVNEEFFDAAKVFLQEKGKEIKEFAKECFIGSDEDLIEQNKNLIINTYKKLMCLMVISIQKNDTHTAELIKQLYRTGFRKEYNQLKKFSKLTVTDVLTFYDYPTYESVARLLFMAHYIFKIELEPEIEIIMNATKEYRRIIEEEMFSYPDTFLFARDTSAQDEITEVKEYVKDIAFAKIKKAETEGKVPYKKFIRMLSLATVLFEQLEINIDIRRTLDLAYKGDLTHQLIIALTAIEYAFDDERYDISKENNVTKPTEKEKQILACILAIAESSFLKEYRYNSMLNALLGLEEEKENRFAKVEKIPELNTINTQPIKEIKMAETTTNNSDTKENTEDISKLKEKYDKKVQELNSCTVLLNEKNAEIRNLKENTEKYDHMEKELQALREYVYLLTEKETTKETKELDEENIERYLSDKNITIIGGDSNWVKKLKNKYKKWNFIKPNASSNISTSTIKNTDYVYFFTDCMKHGVYYRFMGYIRENNIPFGYIHQVNIERNEEQIFKDLKNK